MKSVFILYGKGLLHEDELARFLENPDEFIPEDDETETLGIFESKEEAFEKGNSFQFISIFVEEWRFGDKETLNAWLKDMDGEGWSQVVFDTVPIELDSKENPKDKSLMN